MNRIRANVLNSCPIVERNLPILSATLKIALKEFVKAKYVDSNNIVMDENVCNTVSTMRKVDLVLSSAYCVNL